MFLVATTWTLWHSKNGSKLQMTPQQLVMSLAAKCAKCHDRVIQDHGMHVHISHSLCTLFINIMLVQAILQRKIRKRKKARKECPLCFILPIMKQIRFRFVLFTDTWSWEGHLASCMTIWHRKVDGKWHEELLCYPPCWNVCRVSWQEPARIMTGVTRIMTRVSQDHDTSQLCHMHFAECSFMHTGKARVRE